MARKAAPRVLRLTEFLRPQHIKTKLRSSDKDGVLEELVNLLPLEKRPRALLLEMLRERENVGSTSIGRGVAIPHGRSVVISRLLIACGRSDDGIDFDSADGKPVHLFFLIAAPPIEVGNLYHPALAKVVELVRDARLRKSLLAAEDAEAFWEIIHQAEAT
jgi:mannitol/fructose-specific phosphotransferase system IIA component (Ntr-type)